MSKRRHAVVGTGSRAGMFLEALLGRYSERHELVALLDTNAGRMEHVNASRVVPSGRSAVPTYSPEAFERMLDAERVESVIVCSVDRTHASYITRALRSGRDVITEKPMTIDAASCRDILRAVEESGRSLRVAFNYRYSPRNAQVKSILASGVIGDVLSVHFEWLLDTSHGADYFRRWHRDKSNSGGLMVHKATHHFDLVNWWLRSKPETVFALGALRFYGRANAEARGVVAPYSRYTDEPRAKNDPFALDLSQNAELDALYLRNEPHDGYHRDQNVFGEGISIEDDMAVLVGYESGASLSYHLTAYSPWEGYRVAFNGTKGRLEYEVEESSFTKPRVDVPLARVPYDVVPRDPVRITLRRHWDEPRVIPPDDSAGGHGGGDARLLESVFSSREVDALGQVADHKDGAWSILTGIAANRSFETRMPVRVRELVLPIAL